MRPSLDVAERFGKWHDDGVRAFKGPRISDDFGALNLPQRLAQSGSAADVVQDKFAPVIGGRWP